MTHQQFDKRMKELDATCDRLKNWVSQLREKHQSTLNELIVAERDHAKAIERRDAFGGRNYDLAHPIK